MWTYGFFNSVNGDRTYNAQQMSSIFEGLITSGVYESVGDKMVVRPYADSLGVTIGTGRGWFNKHWAVNDSEYTLTLEASDVTLNRWGAVCIKVDDTDSERSVTPYIKYSEFATTPVKPTMTRSETINEYCLAYVYIPAGATVITASNITDTRADETVCGWVTGLIKQLSSNTLFNQFTDIFNEWFSGLQNNVNADTETMLVNAMPTAVTVTLGTASDSWSWTDTVVNGVRLRTHTVTVAGMTPTKTVLVTPHPDSSVIYEKCEIFCHEVGTNSITFRASQTPFLYADENTELKVNVVYMGQ